MYDLNIRYNAIKSYYAKSVMTEKKGCNRMSFYKTKDLSEAFNFN